ncbi:MAG: hypothetical protein ACKVS8_12225 [Phycisphaerales bacterium]
MKTNGSKPASLRLARPVERGRYAKMFAGKTWSVLLDEDLVALLSGSGSPHAHLAAFANRRALGRERRVELLLLSDKEMRPIAALLTRIGARVERRAPHPNALPLARAHRKAG